MVSLLHRRAADPNLAAGGKVKKMLKVRIARFMWDIESFSNGETFECSTDEKTKQLFEWVCDNCVGDDIIVELLDDNNVIKTYMRI